VFFLLGCWVVFAWTRRLFGDVAALVALVFFALQPTVLAHAACDDGHGRGGDDHRGAYAYVYGRPLVLGLAIAAAVVTKFSAIVFLPFAMLVLQRPRKTVIVAAVVAILGILAVYRFDGPALWRGLQDLRTHNAQGHPSYLFGEVRREGWWYYFPVALWFKTSLPLLVAFAIGIRKRTASLVAAFAMILAIAMLSRISIGVRHVLPLYPLMAIIAAYGVMQLRKSLAILIVVAQIATFALAHPDHLAYFNITAGRDPSRILLDSNLDWGQDLLRLEKACAKHEIDELSIAYFGSADLRRHRLPKLAQLRPFTPVRGWIAISEMHLKDLGARVRPCGAYDWLLQYEPVERVGNRSCCIACRERSSRSWPSEFLGCGLRGTRGLRRNSEELENFA
jgi:hypothetical protein